MGLAFLETCSDLTYAELFLEDGGLLLASIIYDVFLEESVSFSVIEGGLTVPFLRFIFGAALRRGFFLVKTLFETRCPFSLLLLLTLLDLLLSESSRLMQIWHLA